MKIVDFQLPIADLLQLKSKIDNLKS